MLNGNNLVGNLADGMKINILIDTGVTRSLLSEKVIQQSPYLNLQNRYRVEDTIFKVANGQTIVSSVAITFSVEIQGHIFTLEAFVMPDLGSSEIILGLSTLKKA